MITTLSEQETVGSLIEEVRAQGFDNIMVADGYSRDRTTEVATVLGAEVVFQHGKGKAGALLTAFQRANTPYVVVMDGDGNYDSVEIQKLLPLMGTYDFAKRVRERNENMSGTHKLGNRVIMRTFSLLFGTSTGDVCSGMYLLRMEKARGLHLEKHFIDCGAGDSSRDEFVFGSHYDNSRKLQKKSGWHFKDEHMKTGIQGSSY